MKRYCQPDSIPQRPGAAAMVALLLLVAGSSACAPAERQPEATADRPAADLRVLDNLRLVDLTYPLSPSSIYWPTGSPFEHERLDWGVNESGYWYASAAFSSPEHLGTHIDAPLHFSENGWTSAEIPVQRLFAPGIVIDITAEAAAQSDATLDADDINAWEQRNGPIPPEAIVIVRSGWASRWPDWNAYYGTETPEDVGTLHFPGVSEGGARALVERGVAGVGIDTASIDPGVSAMFEAHQVLAAAGIFNLENLTAVDGLPETGFLVVALPMKIEGGTGGPTRVVALLTR